MKKANEIIRTFLNYYPELSVSEIRDAGKNYFIIAPEVDGDLNDPFYLLPKDGSAPGAFPIKDIDDLFTMLHKPLVYREGF